MSTAVDELCHEGSWICSFVRLIYVGIEGVFVRNPTITVDCGLELG
jgi:hypothetical protein